MEDTTIEDMLKTVEASFAQKDYRGALKILEANQSQISPGLWHYNMGTVYGKLENYPLARYHLVMADEKGLSSQEVITNRNLVETKLEIPKFEKPQIWSDYLIKTGVVATQGIFVTISLLLIIGAIIALWKKSSIKIFGLFLTVGLFVMGLNWWIGSWDRKIVLMSQPIYEGPSVIFEARDELPPGIMLVTIKKEGWLEVIYPSRFKGWIKDSGLKELE